MAHMVNEPNNGVNALSPATLTMRQRLDRDRDHPNSSTVAFSRGDRSSAEKRGWAFTFLHLPFPVELHFFATTIRSVVALLAVLGLARRVCLTSEKPRPSINRVM
jgi:hypothetical protein